MSNEGSLRLTQPPRCDNCTYWADWSQRVWARLSSGEFTQSAASGQLLNQDRTSDRGVELRLCRFQPPPTVQQNSPMHTDAGYVCSVHKPTGI